MCEPETASQGTARHTAQAGASEAWGAAGEPLRLPPGIDAAVDDGPVGKHGDDPEDRFHAVGEGADDEEHNAFRSLEETDFARGDHVFGARPRVADHA